MFKSPQDPKSSSAYCCIQGCVPSFCTGSVSNKIQNTSDKFGFKRREEGKNKKRIQDFKLSIYITSFTYMLTLILEPTQPATVFSSCMDSTPNFSTHEHSKQVLDELKISKTPQAADKAKKVRCFRE
jgi:hypothetical protein